VEPSVAIAALAQYSNVKRRLEKIGEIGGVSIYDDFAHHPTAIRATLAALRARVGNGARIIAVLEPRSNTMKLGVHKKELAAALAGADLTVLLQPANLAFDLEAATSSLEGRRRIFTSVDDIIRQLTQLVRRGDHVLIMSNGDFGGIYQRLPAALSVAHPMLKAAEDRPITRA
jgi:UDP-N-acetylmuramate: L-alanyl-gamma-D-glutamyl-meso-diaminopimelate ligase